MWFGFMRALDKYIILFANFLFALLVIACNSHNGHSNARNDLDSLEQPAKIDSVYVNQLSREQIDSLEFRLTNHYTINDNFRVVADSLKLVPREDENTDTCVVKKDDILVVVKIKRNYTVKPDSLDLSNADANLLKSMEEANSEIDNVPSNELARSENAKSDSVVADTVWIKVAGNQYNMGWITESSLLAHTVPNDNISLLLHSMTNTRLLWMGTLLLVGLLGLLFHKKYSNRKFFVVKPSDTDSFYPFLFVILIATLACWYASIQNFAPEFWQEYYFHPTLNPFLLPPIMAVLVIFVWLIIVAFIALLIDLYNNIRFLRGMVYLGEILGSSMLVYLIISWTTQIYIGYVLYAVLVWFLLMLYNGYVKCRYMCGKCGQRMKEKGKCPRCGAIVE